MTTALDRRKRRFGERVGLSESGLIRTVEIPLPLYDRLRDAVRAYVLRSLPPHVLRWADPSVELERCRHLVKTVSVGGIVVPKRDSVLEYNAVARAFAEIGDAVCGEWIGAWHVPPNVRVKFPEVTAEQLARPRPSERPHSDAWAGEHPDSVTLHVPLFGDWRRNYVSAYLPPDDFEESWLDPCSSNDPDHVRVYETGLCNKWGRFKHGEPTPHGHALLMDASVLHASHRELKCGVRLSIEAPFVWCDAPERAVMRKDEHLDHLAMLGLGETHLMYFEDAPGVVRQTDSTKHSAKMRVIELDVIRLRDKIGAAFSHGNLTESDHG